MRRICNRFITLCTVVALICLTTGIAAAQGDLDNDGIADTIDPETIVSSSISLLAGEYSFQNLTITNNAVLTLDSNTSLSGFKGVSLIAHNLMVDTGSVIIADGKGYSNGAGPGGGTGSNYFGGGGSYGGRGGFYSGPVYGSALAPVDLGSGGYGGYPGGGAIRIQVSDSLDLNGNITANGILSTPPTDYFSASGAGSGGSVYIITKELTGSGKIAANGGYGGYISYSGWRYGSGGGGRIAVYYTSSSFTGSSEARGGTTMSAGQDGTVVFIDTATNTLKTGHSFRFEVIDSPFVFNEVNVAQTIASAPGNITINTDNFLINSSAFTIDGSGTIIVRKVNLADSQLTLNGNISFVADDTLLMVNSAYVLSGNQSVSAPALYLINSTFITSGADSLTTNDISLVDRSVISMGSQKKMDLVLNRLSIDETSSISADGKGYSNGAGPGGGTGSNYYGGGGSYGGRGGFYSGPVYGSALAPVDLGSGGYGGYPGGGAIRIQVSDSLDLNGNITANGILSTPPTDYLSASGAGSGGSVYIITKELTGSGKIAANGGYGGYISYSGWRYGSGGGGRIAVYYTSSTFTGSSEARGGTTMSAGQDGTVVMADLRNETETPVNVAFLTQSVRNEKNLTETIRITNYSMTNAGCNGDLHGSLSLSSLVMISIDSGSFTGKGLTKGNWQATLGNLPYQGQWSGMFFLHESERKIYLKGTTSGDMSGVIEGYLTESISGSGIYDHYNSTWQINELGHNPISATFVVNGTLSYQGETVLPSTRLYFLQTSVQGHLVGYDSGPIDIVLTHIRVADTTNPYEGEGFSIISYISNSGSGAGWTYDQTNQEKIIQMGGVFTKPNRGLVTGILDERKIPQTLTIVLERLDIGLPPMPDLKVESSGPLGISPGQTIDYIMTVRNDGLAASGPFTLTDELPWEVEYVSNTGNGTYKHDAREVVWDVDALDPRKTLTFATTVKVDPGLSSHIFYNIVSIPKPGTGLQIDPNAKMTYNITESSANLTKLTLYYSNSTENLSYDVGINVTEVPRKFATSYQFNVTDGTLESMYDVTIEGSWERVIAFVKGSYKLYTGVNDFRGAMEGTEDAIEAARVAERDLSYIQTARNQGLLSQQDFEYYANAIIAKFVGPIVISDGVGKIPVFGNAYNKGLEKADFKGALEKAWQHNVQTSIEINKAFIDARTSQSQAIAYHPHEVNRPRDPNVKFGPGMRVAAGQKLDYEVEFENVGDGVAYGVYVVDTLDENLDMSTLKTEPVYSTTTGLVIAPPGIFNPETRTITWLAGDVGPHEGGYSNYSINIRNDAPDGTEIINSATVHFPSVFEETKTNAIVSVVGYNQLPDIHTVLPKIIYAGEILEFPVEATDPDGDTLTFRVSTADNTSLPAGASFDPETRLFNWTPSAQQAGTYNISISVSDWKGESNIYVPIFVQSRVFPLPGYTIIPTDPDGDGIYEDLNANGRLDFADVVLYFNQMTWIAANEPIAAFDLNGNGRIDFADIVALFNEI